MGQTIVVGGGPIGIFCGIALARRGHEVLLVDRDPGPAPSGDWKRLGVMQFMHPHFFRPQVVQSLQEEMPDVWESILAAGGEARQLPGAPPGVTGLACRRWVLERTLRAAAAREPGLVTVVGHADRIVVEKGVVRGVQVDGGIVEADLVISVTGRASPLGHELRGEHEGGMCGLGYVSRMYRDRAGRLAEDLPAPSWITSFGYGTLAIPQDDNTLSVLFTAPMTDPALAGIRGNVGFQAGAQAVPNLVRWTDPDRFEPITDVLVGGGLTNTYFPQGPEPGVPPAVGLFFGGDAVCTTNPAAGRGVGLGLLGARRLLSLLDDRSIALDDASRALDAWCEEQLRPWFADHVYWDATLLQRYAGNDLDLDAQIPSDVICAAGEALPEIMPAVGLYLGMVTGPDILRTVEDDVRALLKSGWRPPYDGPTAGELADIVNRALAAADPASSLEPA
ncbi:MAG TPA: FAD-dependent oxidoreductase [Mycobacteriales bacterium]|nr:FAD-dependent oxidoreductase [Mycobacteriales bacterium]